MDLRPFPKVELHSHLDCCLSYDAVQRIDSGISREHYARHFVTPASAGLGVTGHAGESGGPESVRRPSTTRRIGHGVRSIEDAALVERLEICPTCNGQTRAVRSLEDHPVDRLRRAGVRVGISTDTRAVTDVRLTQEYERLRDIFGWTVADFLQVNRDALDVAFAPDTVKRRVAEAFGEVRA